MKPIKDNFKRMNSGVVATASVIGYFTTIGAILYAGVKTNEFITNKISIMQRKKCLEDLRKTRI